MIILSQEKIKYSIMVKILHGILKRKSVIKQVITGSESIVLVKSNQLIKNIETKQLFLAKRGLASHAGIFRGARFSSLPMKNQPAKTSVSPRSSPLGTFRETFPAAKSEEKRMFSQANEKRAPLKTPAWKAKRGSAVTVLVFKADAFRFQWCKQWSSS